MTESQRMQMEEARRESIEKTYNVCADGRKKMNEYDQSSNQVNNE